MPRRQAFARWDRAEEVLSSPALDRHGVQPLTAIEVQDHVHAPATESAVLVVQQRPRDHDPHIPSKTGTIDRVEDRLLAPSSSMSDPTGIASPSKRPGSPGSTLTGNSQLLQLVAMASRSPSGHNAQPWKIVRTAEQRLVLRSEPSRRLPMIDPANRELLLSFGAMIETIRQAAPAFGYRVDLRILADRPEATDIAQVDLSQVPAVPSNIPALIRSRATTRTPFMSVELDPGAVDHILDLDRNALSFVPRETAHGRWLAKATADAFAQQTWDDRRQGELAQWLRFSRHAVRVRGDGLTPEALGLSPLARAVWYSAFSRRQALRPSFRRSSVKVTRRQVDGCAGFLLVTSTDRSVGALLEAGATYLRALLVATDLGVAHHTMSYALEEDPWRQDVDAALETERPVQFIVRIGEAKHLAEPSIRRPTTSLFENRVA